MNRIPSSKNLTKKIAIFLLVFFIFVFSYNSSKAQNKAPSDLLIFPKVSGQAITYLPFKIYSQTYSYISERDNGEIIPGAYNEKIKKIRAEIDALPLEFDSSFSLLLTNSGNLGLGEGNNKLIGKIVFKQILDKQIKSLMDLKSKTTNKDEQAILVNLIGKMSETQTELGLLNLIGSDKIITFHSEKFQLSEDGTKIVNITKVDTDSKEDGFFKDSYKDFINELILIIDKKAGDDAAKQNPDILKLKKEINESEATFNKEADEIRKTIEGSNVEKIDKKNIIDLATKEALTPIKNTISTYLNDKNNEKPGNEKIIETYGAVGQKIDENLNETSQKIKDSGIKYDPTGGTLSRGGAPDCTAKGFWDTAFSTNTNCSVAAYLVNLIISGVASLVGVVVDLAGALFEWIYDKGVINFKDWVTGSGAYLIYKRIILSLIVSVMTFFVFYLIIRRLIDDDGDKMNKILPGLIITFLFVYFSFTITGWIIDQSNIITIKIYRSMTQQEENNEQGIATVLQRTLNLEKKATEGNAVGDNLVSNFGVSYGSWDAVPFTLGQLVVNIVSVFVLFQGATLILSRTIILLLCMIFSPLMILPEGLTEFTDKYKRLVMDNFTGNILLGPVFMFLVLLAVEIGQATTSWMGASGNAPGYKPSLAEAPPNFLGGIISSVLVIVVLQLAISASKSLSGSMGEKLSGVIGKYAGKAGGLAFSGGKTLGGGALRGVMNNTKTGDKINDWITKGSTKSGLRGRLFSGAKNITEKYKLDGKEKKEEKESGHIVETYNKANTRQKEIIKKDLEERALKGEKGAESALKKINKNIEDEKNTEFEREEKTKKRESYEQKEKGGEKPPDANEASHVEAGTKPTTPPTQNANAQGIPKENKEKGIQLHNSPHKEDGEDNAHENDDRELVQHENNFTHSSKGDSSNNHNNDSQNKAIHTDNLQVVANNIQLLTGDKLVNRARKTNEEGAGPKAYISNGEESSVTQNKPVIISNNSREEKNVSGNQMKANIDTAKKITSKNNKDEEYIEYEDIPTSK